MVPLHSSCALDLDMFSDMISKGAVLLDLEFEICEDKSYPKDWHTKRGCVRVEKGKMKKTEILPAIGKVLVQNQ